MSHLYTLYVYVKNNKTVVKIIYIFTGSQSFAS